MSYRRFRRGERTAHDKSNAAIDATGLDATGLTFRVIGISLALMDFKFTAVAHLSIPLAAKDQGTKLSLKPSLLLEAVKFVSDRQDLRNRLF